jgi:hypothetical protein
MKANNSPKVTRPSTNIAGIQTISDIYASPKRISDLTYSLFPSELFAQNTAFRVYNGTGLAESSLPTLASERMPSRLIRKIDAADEGLRNASLL